MLFSPLPLRGVWKPARMFFKPARAPGESGREHPVAPPARGGEELAVSTGKLLWLPAVAPGVSVASLYYCPPLLALLAADFSTTERGAGLVPTLTQAGYAAGMLLVVPLGDTADRRRLIVFAALCSAAAVLAVAAATSLAFLCAASFALGLATVVPQLAVPFAAGIVPAAERVRSVGKVTSGLLVGILLSRTVSGLIGAHLGWRAMYLIATAVTLLLAPALRIFLPRQEPAPRLSYPGLLRSLPGLLREPLLRRHAILGALALAAFSAFWTTLTFLLEALRVPSASSASLGRSRRRSPGRLRTASAHARSTDSRSCSCSSPTASSRPRADRSSCSEWALCCSTSAYRRTTSRTRRASSAFPPTRGIGSTRSTSPSTSPAM